MLVGFRVQNDDFITENARLGGRCSVGRVFPAGMAYTVGGSVTTFKNNIINACQNVLDAGMTPAFSFKFSGEPTSVTNGSADSYLAAIKDVCNGMPNVGGRPGSYAIWHHEDDRTSISAANFASATNYVYNKIKVPSNRVGPVFSAYQWRSNVQGIMPSTWLPANYDFAALDIYSADWSGNTRDLGQMQELQNWWQNIPKSKPIIFMERGISTGVNATPGDQGDTINRDYAFIKSVTDRTIEAYLYWDSMDGSGSTPPSTFYLDNGGATALTAMANAENPPPPVYPTHTPVLPEVSCDQCKSIIDADGAQLHYQTYHGAP